jgi:hypothetical protein
MTSVFIRIPLPIRRADYFGGTAVSIAACTAMPLGCSAAYYAQERFNGLANKAC